jgi:hypothetical protein
MGTLLDTPEKKRRAAAFFIEQLNFALILLGDNRQPLGNCGQCPAGEHKIQDCPHAPSVCHGWQAGTKDLGHFLGLMRRFPNANIGVVNALSDLVTVDVDTNRNGKPMPELYKSIEGIPGDADGWETFSLVLNRYRQPWPIEPLWTRTRNGGAHFTWRLPAGQWIKSDAGRFGWLVDVKASKAYVPAPGTVVKGGCYERMGTVMDPGPAPEWLLHHLKVTGHFPEPPKPYKPREPRADRDRSWGYGQLDKYAQEYATAAQQTGHDAMLRLTTAAAHLVAEGLVSETDAYNDLYDAGVNRPRDAAGQRAFESEFKTAWRSALVKAGGTR